MKLEWEGNIYPRVIKYDEGFEIFETLIPDPTGDFLHAVIDSDNNYEFVDFVAANEVKVLE